MRKRYVAALDVALIGPLFCMSPQVIEEVVPAAEHLSTTVEFTAKKSNQPVRFRVEVL